MAAHAPPPFHPNGDTLEQAVVEHIDQTAQLKKQRNQLDALIKLVGNLGTEVMSLKASIDASARRAEVADGAMSRCLAEVTTWGLRFQGFDSKLDRILEHVKAAK